MADNNFLRNDLRSMLAELKGKDRLLKLKRRWLIGAPLSNSELERLLSNHECVPESLLREDDIFYDNVKAFVEQQAHRVEREVKVKTTSQHQFLNVNNIEGILLSCLDSLTSKGLYLLAMLFTKGVLKFEKTQKKMKKVIKKSIPGFLRNLQKSNDDYKVVVDSLAKLSRILTDRENVRQECSYSHLFQWRAAAVEILDRVQELPTEALLAMCRKLAERPAELPCLQKKRRDGRSRGTLIDEVTRTSGKMVSELVGSGRHGVLQEPLARALMVAGLSLKLKRCPGSGSSCITDLMKCSPEMESLQAEIMKAIWLLETTKVRMPELEALQHLLDPSANNMISKRSLRSRMKKLFVEYLFDCNDLDSIPEGLLKALKLINRSSRVSPDHGYSLNHEEEAECILCVSSDIKQLVWDLIPGTGLAENFGDAYMEQPCESEDDDDDDDDCADSSTKPFDDSPSSPSGSMYSENMEESIAEHIPLEFELGHMLNPDQEADSRSSDSESSNLSPSIVLKDRCDVKAESYQSPRNTSDLCASNLRFSGEEESAGPDNQILCNNLYLDVQEASDQTSLVAYNLIGHVLDGLATLEERLDLDCRDGYLRGDDYSFRRDPEEAGKSCPKEQQSVGSMVVEVVEELIPSFPRSAVEKLKELIMGT